MLAEILSSADMPAGRLDQVHFLSIFTQKKVKNVFLLPGLIACICWTACQSPKTPKSTVSKTNSPANAVNADTVALANTDAATILHRKQVPILCYHQIRDWRPTDSKRSRDYIVPVDSFLAQLKMLADSGYHTILPNQLYGYLTKGRPLPHKAILLTFDDTDLPQFTIAAPEMKKYGFKGVFFIMTVALGKTNYMSREQVRELSDAGHVIGAHTWDHHDVRKYKGSDWVTQIEKPTRELETITGKPIRYFAYPFGLWNEEAIPELKKYGFIGAFQLSQKPDPKDPLYTIRRIIVPGSWSPATLDRSIRRDF